jgi:hypothetical protein
LGIEGIERLGVGMWTETAEPNSEVKLSSRNMTIGLPRNVFSGIEGESASEDAMDSWTVFIVATKVSCDILAEPETISTTGIKLVVVAPRVEKERDLW